MNCNNKKRDKEKETAKRSVWIKGNVKQEYSEGSSTKKEDNSESFKPLKKNLVFFWVSLETIVGGIFRNDIIWLTILISFLATIGVQREHVGSCYYNLGKALLKLEWGYMVSLQWSESGYIFKVKTRIADGSNVWYGKNRDKEFPTDLLLVVKLGISWAGLHKIGSYPDMNSGPQPSYQNIWWVSIVRNMYIPKSHFYS